jgi:hypothetical protein
MNVFFRRSASILAALALFAGSPALAQLEANLSSLTGDNAVGYLQPFPNALSAMLNSAIFRTGDVPVAGFNLGIEAKAMIVDFSDDDRVYAPVVPSGFSVPEAPTVIGNTTGATSPGPGGSEIGFPGGFDMDRFGIAVPQITIGSIMGTRAIVRYISVELGDTELGDLETWGIGAQHSISQYFPGLPVSVAAGVMYQEFKIGKDIVDSDSWAFNVTGSKRFGSVFSFEPYLGVGLDSFAMTSKYDNTSLSESIEVDFDRANDIHLALGAGIGLPVIKLHGEYTVAAENGFAGGLTLGF